MLGLYVRASLGLMHTLNYFNNLIIISFKFSSAGGLPPAGQPSLQSLLLLSVSLLMIHKVRKLSEKLNDVCVELQFSIFSPYLNESVFRVLH